LASGPVNCTPLDFIITALDSADANADTFVAAAAGLARHHQAARRQLVADLVAAEDMAAKLDALAAHDERLEEIGQAQRLLDVRVRRMAALRGVQLPTV
jgi:hypothetical protein